MANVSKHTAQFPLKYILWNISGRFSSFVVVVVFSFSDHLNPFPFVILIHLIHAAFHMDIDSLVSNWAAGYNPQVFVFLFFLFEGRRWIFSCTSSSLGKKTCWKCSVKTVIFFSFFFLLGLRWVLSDATRQQSCWWGEALWNGRNETRGVEVKHWKA